MNTVASLKKERKKKQKTKQKTLWGKNKTLAVAQSSYPGAAAFSQSTPRSPLTTQTNAAPEFPHRTMLPVHPRCSL